MPPLTSLCLAGLGEAKSKRKRRDEHFGADLRPPRPAELPVPVCGASDGDSAQESVLLEAAVNQSETNMQKWLAAVGLGKTNPFARWDAGADPDLSNYLVRHDVFRTIWHDSPSVVFAPLGGGKSAFRVRLSYACRVEEDERRVFPILYLAPKPTALDLETHLESILRNAAQELLLALAYRPGRFTVLDDAGKQAVRRTLDQNDPGLLSEYLPKLKRAGTLVPLIKTFDPSAAHLPAPARPEQVRSLCATLEGLAAVSEVPPVRQRFAELINLLLGLLGFEAIYILVDGVDAFIETGSEPDRAVEVVQPLLQEMKDWADQRVFLKLFLPTELSQLLSPLTKQAKTATIRWVEESLIDVLRTRLRAASRGEFDSLDAISDKSIHGIVESKLLKAIPPLPRDLLVLANQLVVEHVRRTGANGLLDEEDLKAALHSYSPS
jgi:hypothetical protein